MKVPRNISAKLRGKGNCVRIHVSANAARSEPMLAINVRIPDNLPLSPTGVSFAYISYQIGVATPVHTWYKNMKKKKSTSAICGRPLPEKRSTNIMHGRTIRWIKPRRIAPGFFHCW